MVALASNEGETDEFEGELSSTSHAHAGEWASWAPAYLSALAISGKQIESAKSAGVTFKAVWKLRRRAPAFIEAEKHSIDQAKARLEDEVIRRAVDGLKRYKFTKSGAPIMDPRTGEQFYEMEYSETLLLRALERLDPTWRSKQQIEHSVGAVPTTAADRRAALEAARVAKLGGGAGELKPAQIIETSAIEVPSLKSEEKSAEVTSDSKQAGCDTEDSLTSHST